MITHVTADGNVRDAMTGVMVDRDSVVYMILREIQRRTLINEQRGEKDSQHKEGMA